MSINPYSLRDARVVAVNGLAHSPAKSRSAQVSNYVRHWQTGISVV